MQQTDYPRTRPDMPNHEPRGCPRGASYSWYLYSANRLKYPLMRKRLMKMWREAKVQHSDPVDAWASIIEDADKAKSFKQAAARWLCAFLLERSERADCRLNVYTVKTYGTAWRASDPGDVDGLLRIRRAICPDRRYLPELLRLVLRPAASPQTWGEQTDVPESADWYNSSYIIAWGSNVPQTRTRMRTSLPKSATKAPKPLRSPRTTQKSPNCATCGWHRNRADARWRWRWATSCCVSSTSINQASTSDYVRRYTDMPMLVMLEERDGYYAAGRMLRAADLVDALGQENNPEWKTVACNSNGELVAPNGSIGFRWGERANGTLNSVTVRPAKRRSCV
jgi:nitrate reductase alpha subunit